MHLVYMEGGREEGGGIEARREGRREEKRTLRMAGKGRERLKDGPEKGGWRDNTADTRNNADPGNTANT